MATYDYLDVGLAVMPSLDELLAASGSTTQTTATLFERTVSSGAFAGYHIRFTGTDFVYFSGGQPYSGTIQQIAVLRPDNVVIARTTDFGALDRDLTRFADAEYLLADVPIYGSGSADHIVAHGADVYAAGGNDTITAAGTNSGTVDVGDGDDLVSLTGSNFISELAGGAGQDVLEIDAGFVSTTKFSGFETLRFGASSPYVSIGFPLAEDAVLPAKLQVDAIPGSSVATISINPGASGTSVDLSQWTFNSAAMTRVRTNVGSTVTNFIGSSVSDRISIDLAGGTFSGRGGDDEFVSYSQDSLGDVVASGGDGNDTFLFYRSGRHILSGGAGDDLFRFNVQAVAQIDGGDGTDLISLEGFYDGVSVTLNGDTEVEAGRLRIKNVEGLITSIYRDTLIGDELANTFRASGGDDVLQGKGGKDILDGGAGNDLADYSEKTAAVAVVLNDSTAVTVKVGGIAEDTISGIENLNGGAGFDVLTGGDSNNAFSGNGGGDLLTGYGGNDNLDGGAGDDSLSGDDGADTLSGGSGDDKFGGGAGIDAIDGGAGSDTAFFRDKTTAVVATLDGADVVTVTVGGTAEDSLRNVENLTGGAGNDRFTGDGLANTLDGSTGNDILDGKAGADVMIGGLGNDSFTVDNVADKVVEANGAGIDGVVSSVSFSVASQFVENLLLTGSADINAFGNNLDNVITGNAGANALTGYLGKDLFLFRTGLGAGNADTIRDFRVADDTIGLGTNIFTQAHGLRADGTGTLLSGEFRANTTGLAQDGDDRIIYETDTGNVFYDANGNAAGGSFLFAKVGAGLALTNADFLLV